MSSRPAIITEGDVARIMKGAKKAGVTLGIIVTGKEIRFVPVDELAPEQKLSDLDRWKAGRDARKAKAQAHGRS